MTTYNADSETPDRPMVSAGCTPRRGFFLRLGFCLLGFVGVLWSLGTLRFLFPNVLTEPSSKFKAGFPGDHPPGHVDTRLKDQFGVWIVNGLHQGKQQIYALSTRCTHLGCITIWQENEKIFKCPCHGSGFYMDGINFSGPAPRPLERYAMHIADDGQLEVDKSKVFQHELGQWDNAESYVTSG